MKPPRVARSPNTGGGSFGPRVLPGTYTVRITKNGQSYTGKIEIFHDSASGITLAERRANFAALMRLYTMIEETAYIVERMLHLRDTLQSRAYTRTDELGERMRRLAQQLDSVYYTIVAKKASLFADTEPQLREKLADLYGDIAFYPGQPTDEQLNLIDQYAKRLSEIQQWFDGRVDSELKPINERLHAESLPTISLMTREQFDRMASY